jgi:two-component sensor histidine kinase
LASSERGLVGHFAGVQVFTTFYPAIIIAALIGGLWPGILATVLSVVAAWYLVIPQFFTWTIGQRELVEFLLFVVISGIDVAIAVASYVLGGRVKALSQAYAILEDAAWKGASLAQIIAGQSILDTKRVTVDGCEIAVTARAAQQFAMIIHELATNALKYGALSSPDGRVLISCKTERHNGGGSFVFLWKESGGPRASPPTRRGFGSVILLEAAEQFGHVTVNYPPEGLIYQLQLDLKAIEIPRTLIPLPNANIARSVGNA